MLQHGHCYAEFHYGECRYGECQYAECRYAECHYAECRGAHVVWRDHIIKLFSLGHNQNRLGHYKHFIPNLIFARKAGSYLSGAP
jgi:hypothetical protein